MERIFSKTVLIFTIFLLRYVSSPDPPPEFINLLKTLESCLLVLYDYSGTNWALIISIPLVRVKLKVYQSTWESNGTNYTYYSADVDRNFSSYPIAYRATYHVCAFEFHLFPPIEVSSSTYGIIKFTDRMRIPNINVGYSYIGRLDHYAIPYKISEYNFHKVLITNVTDPKKWGAWAKPLVEGKRGQWSAASLFDVIVIKDIGKSRWDSDDGGGSQFYFLCELCTPCHATFILLSKSDLISLVALKAAIARHTVGVVDRTWTINHLSLNGVDIAMQDARLCAATYHHGRPVKYLNFRKYDSRRMNLDLILFKLAFDNATMTGVESGCEEVPLIEGIEDNVKYAKLFMYVYNGQIANTESNGPLVLMDLFMGQILTYKSEGLEFTTCRAKSSGLVGVADLATPLDDLTWLLLLLSCTAICVLLSIGYTLLGSNANTFSTTLLLVGCGSLLEQSNAWAKNQSTPKRFSEQFSIPIYSNFAYVICATWILAGLILSNSYKGEYVKRLTIPPTRATYTKFEELIKDKFSVYTIPSDASVYINALNQSKPGQDVSMYGNSLSLISIFEYFLEGRDEWGRKYDSNSSDYKMILQLKNITTIPPDYVNISTGYFSFTDLIKNCNDSKGTALASWTDHVLQVHAHLQAIYPHFAISKSVQPLAKLAKGWALFNWGNDIVLSRISGLMSSGLAEKWYKLSNEKSVTKYIKIAQSLRQAWKKLDFGENMDKEMQMIAKERTQLWNNMNEWSPTHHINPNPLMMPTIQRLVEICETFPILEGNIVDILLNAYCATAKQYLERCKALAQKRYHPESEKNKRFVLPGFNMD
ncbi:hypothetical protein Fcan01_01364 [Folsomia candida]|uniref:Uncharacterized protein n=1 Tax=Folsomia candida TaxID=158441 RepID=A0A226F5L4_FOLCA|nr:hypothetical protein Fcan01_01364 [Folsomia candida]